MADPNQDSDDTATHAGIKSPAGRVEFDRRGNSVWRWARTALDSTSVLLKRLENRDLALEPTQKVPIQRVAGGNPDKKHDAKSAPAKKLGLADAADRDGGGGFDPYNSR